MASKTKEMRRQEEALKQMIVDGHRRGICNSEGESVKDKQGRSVAKPRNLGPRAMRTTYKR